VGQAALAGASSVLVLVGAWALARIVRAGLDNPFTFATINGVGVTFLGPIIPDPVHGAAYIAGVSTVLAALAGAGAVALLTGHRDRAALLFDIGIGIGLLLNQPTYLLFLVTARLWLARTPVTAPVPESRNSPTDAADAAGSHAGA